MFQALQPGFDYDLLELFKAGEPRSELVLEVDRRWGSFSCPTLLTALPFKPLWCSQVSMK